MNGFEIEFAERVAGPLCLGYGSHFGLGLFIAGQPDGAFFRGYLVGFVHRKFAEQECGVGYPFVGSHAYEPFGRLLAFSIKLW